MKINSRTWFRARNAEKLLMTLIICGIILVCLYQTMLSQSPLQQVINRVGSDAQTVLQPTVVSDNSIILQLVNFSTLPKAQVLINGSVKANFSHPFVILPVLAGDLVEVDVTYYDHPVVIKVLDTSEGIARPVKGAEISGKKTVLVIGKVVGK